MVRVRGASFITNRQGLGSSVLRDMCPLSPHSPRSCSPVSLGTGPGRRGPGHWPAARGPGPFLGRPARVPSGRGAGSVGAESGRCATCMPIASLPQDTSGRQTSLSAAASAVPAASPPRGEAGLRPGAVLPDLISQVHGAQTPVSGDSPGRRLRRGRAGSGSLCSDVTKKAVLRAIF